MVLIGLADVYTNSELIVELDIGYIIYSNPSIDEDIPFSICVYNGYIYIIGFDSVEGDARFRIEKRFLSNGSLVKVWTYNPSKGDDWLTDCLIVGDRIYVVGFDNVPGGYDYRWSLLILSHDLEVMAYLTQNPTSYDDWATSIASDGEYIYIAGYTGGADYMWRIEKRRIDSLDLVSMVVLNPSDGIDVPYAIGVNPYVGAGYIWVVGFVQRYIIWWWRVEILDKELNSIRSIELDIVGTASGIAFDERGFSYVVGDYVLVKFDSTGSRLREPSYGVCRKIVYYNGSVYIACSEFIYNSMKHVVYSLDSDLELVNKIVLSRNISFDSLFTIGRMAVADDRLCIAGYDYGDGKGRWTVYLLDLKNISRPRMTTLTTTETIVNTVTTVQTETVREIETVTYILTSTIVKTVSETYTKSITRVDTYTTVVKQVEIYTVSLISTTIRVLTETITRLSTFTKTLTKTPIEAIFLSTFIPIAVLLVVAVYIYTKTRP